MIKECKKCLYRQDHPFGITFDSQGVCSGCKNHEEKFNLNWDQRFELLIEKVNKYKGDGDYQCIIPIKGTPENFYLVDVVVNKLKLKPLLVAYNSQFNSEVAIYNFDLIREIFDLDIIHYTTNPFIYKKLIKECLFKFNSIRWPYIAGEKQFPVKVASEMKIPLIIWPFFQANEQVGANSYVEEIQMTRRSWHEFDLMGIDPKDMNSVGSLIQESDIEDLLYPSNKLLIKNNIVGIYLDNYIPWDSRKFSEEMIKKFSAGSSLNKRTFDTYDRIDDKTYMTIHDVIKFHKLGYSRVTDNLCREIRFGRISKADAIKLNEYYQSEYPKEEILFFLNWLGVKEKGFNWLLERMPKFSENKKIKTELTKNQQKFIDSFIINNNPVHKNSNYIVFGKGLEI